MKTFKRFLSEAPIDFGSDDEKEKLLRHKSGNYYYDDFKKSFNEKYKILGNDNGSSRIAFKVPVDAKLFKAQDLEEIGKSKGSIETAVKLAKNKNGLFQNRVELEIWNRIKGTPGSEFFCPVIDWSGNPAYKNNIYYEINHNLTTKNGSRTSPFWIQMPLVKTFSYSENNPLYKLVIETFGQDEIPDMYTNLNDIKKMFEDEKINEKQFQNCLNFIKICSKEGLSDFHYGNIGIYRDRLVILDYGYNDDTDKIYWDRGTTNLNVEINDDGEVELTW